jgi:hypothetical protein
MRTLIVTLILAALTLFTLVVAPLFPEPAPFAGKAILGTEVDWKHPDAGIRYRLRRAGSREQF